MPIFGEDNRLDLYDVEDQRILQLADSTVMIFRLVEGENGKMRRQLVKTGSGYRIDASTLDEKENLCPGVRFAAQTSAHGCTGTLVGTDLILTAGHCIKDLADCKSKQVAFGYAIKERGHPPGVLAKDEVYSCVEIVARHFGKNNDWAVFRLDRSVAGHFPLEINRSGKIKKGTPVFTIGHSDGLPTKVAGGAVVLHGDANFFETDLDAFPGNSGSPIFNARTGLIEGVLSNGADYSYALTFDEAKGEYSECQEARKIGEDEIGSIFIGAVYASSAAGVIPPLEPHAPARAIDMPAVEKKMRDQIKLLVGEQKAAIGPIKL
jgi:hypothetical protein